MFCDQCQNRDCLTEVYAKEKVDIDGRVHRQQLCRQCLIGHVVPAYRPVHGTWNWGQVVAWKGDMFNLDFSLSEELPREWLALEAKPVEAYLSHHRAADSSTPATSTSSGAYRSSPRLPVDKGVQERNGMKKQHRQHQQIFRRVEEPVLPLPFDPIPFPPPHVPFAMMPASPPPGAIHCGVEDGSQKGGPRLWTIDVSESLGNFR
jgi:hypothetical protein